MKKSLLILIAFALTLTGCAGAFQTETPAEEAVPAATPMPAFYNPDEMITKDEMIEDIDFLRKQLITIHPKYKDAPENFEHIDEYIPRLKDDLPDSMNEYEFRYYLNSIVALTDDTHSWVRFDFLEYKYWLDLQVKFTQNAIYVTESNRYFDVGDEIIKIDSYDYDGILSVLDSVKSNESDYGLLFLSQYDMRNIMFYQYLDVIDSKGEVKFTIKKADGTQKAMNVKLENIRTRRFGYYAEPYSYYIDKENSLGYVDIRTSEASVEFKQFMEEFYTEAKEEDVEKIVIDIRNNGGGNSYYIYYLLSGMNIDEYYDSEGRFIKNHFKKDIYCSDAQIYLFVGGGTMSAAINSTAVLKSNDLVTIVGTPPGDTTQMYAYNYDFELFNPLPNPDLEYGISTRENFIKCLDEEIIQPHIFIEPTQEDIINGVDPLLEWVIAQ